MNNILKYIGIALITCVCIAALISAVYLFTILMNELIFWLVLML